MLKWQTRDINGGISLKNTIQIDRKILKASIDVQLKKEVEMIDLPDIMNEDIMTVDRDFLLMGLAGILNIEIDWEDNLVITDKKAYNTNEFLIKFLSIGRKVLYKNQVGETL